MPELAVAVAAATRRGWAAHLKWPAAQHNILQMSGCSSSSSVAWGGRGGLSIDVALSVSSLLWHAVCTLHVYWPLYDRVAGNALPHSKTVGLLLSFLLLERYIYVVVMNNLL